MHAVHGERCKPDACHARATLLEHEQGAVHDNCPAVGVERRDMDCWRGKEDMLPPAISKIKALSGVENVEGHGAISAGTWRHGHCDDASSFPRVRVHDNARGRDDQGTAAWGL